jgi:hypothetical protein
MMAVSSIYENIIFDSNSGTEHSSICQCNICLAKKSNDSINWPKHYNASSIQPIDAIEAWKLDFRLANAVKYLARAGKKDPKKLKEDLQKAIWYIQRYIDKECNDGKEN